MASQRVRVGRVYGRRPERTQLLNSQLFSGTLSSSPAQEDAERLNKIQEQKSLSPAQVPVAAAKARRRNRSGKSKLPSSTAGRPETRELDPLDDLNEAMNELKLLESDKNERKNRETNSSRVEKRINVLTPRDVNANTLPEFRRNSDAAQKSLCFNEVESCGTIAHKIEEPSTSARRLRKCNVSPSTPDRNREQKTADDYTTGGIDRNLRKNYLDHENLPLKLRRSPRKPASTSPSAEIVFYAQPLLELCSDITGKTAPAHFQDWADSIDAYFLVTKIAEASYGEVYRLSLKDSIADFSKGDESVLKIIALKPPPLPAAQQDCQRKRKPNKESEKVAAMSAVNDVASEARLLRRMSPVPGFTNFREVRVMQGRLPTQFVKAWKHFNKTVKKSLFPDPARKTSYDENQLWAVLEMQDAGKDLENITCEDVFMVWDAFWGVAIALAKGEEWAQFEHRDLHLGNICVKVEGQRQDSKRPSMQKQRKLGFTGLETTLIDYTLSRAKMANTSANSSDQPQGDDIAYFDLSKDEAIFQGDGAEDYQYDMYRHMRSAATQGDPLAVYKQNDGSEHVQKDPQGRRRQGRKEFQRSTNDNELRNVWRNHHPLTNLVWLHFVLYKLVEQVSTWPSEAPEVDELALRLEEQLKTLRKVLALETMSKCGLASAADLVNWCVGEGWLNEVDVVGRVEASWTCESPSQGAKLRGGTSQR